MSSTGWWRRLLSALKVYALRDGVTYTWTYGYWRSQGFGLILIQWGYNRMVSMREVGKKPWGWRFPVYPSETWNRSSVIRHFPVFQVSFSLITVWGSLVWTIGVQSNCMSRIGSYNDSIGSRTWGQCNGRWKEQRAKSKDQQIVRCFPVTCQHLIVCTTTGFLWPKP